LGQNLGHNLGPLTRLLDINVRRERPLHDSRKAAGESEIPGCHAPSDLRGRTGSPSLSVHDSHFRLPRFI
jgi:hypothetical protein